MKNRLGPMAFTLLLLSCGNASQTGKTDVSKIPLVGTWKLISGTTIVKADTTMIDYTKDQEMIKIINDSHFAFFKHDFSKGKDSVIFGAGGGSYALSGDQYTEHLDYCSDKEWENHIFTFTVSIVNDTLSQKGVEKLEKLGIDRVIIEKYIRVK